MRYVLKGPEPASLGAWRAQGNAAWTPTYRDLRSSEKSALHCSLLAEQGQTCCYCGRRIGLHDSHIEHFAPQDAYEDQALDYGNLFASCIREQSPGAPLHCGHGKANHFDALLAIHPTDSGCEHRFRYSKFDGAITPAEAEDAPAHHMIGLLQLDIDFLRQRRAEALDGMFDDAFESSASLDELRLLAVRLRQEQSPGAVRSFGHALARYAEQLLQLRSGQ